jgi:putative oxidoreductase
VAVDSTRVSPSSSNYGKPSDLTPGRCSRPFSGLPVVRSSVDSKETVWDRITGLKLFKTVTTWEGVHAVPLVPLRFMSGLLMVHHGSEGGMLPANFGTPEFSGFVDFVVSPYFGFLPGTPEFWSAVHDYTEFWGGWCLVLGFLTRPAALSLFVTMMGAVYFHLSSVGPQGFPLGHVPNYSYDFEEPTLYGLIFLLFWFNGAGTCWCEGLERNS